MRIVQIVACLLLLTPTLFQAQAICPPGCECDSATGIAVCEPSAAAAGCPCGSIAYLEDSVGSCPGTINPTCNGATDPYSMMLSCDPGGVDPPGLVVGFVSDDGNDQCYGLFARFLGTGQGYETYFDTGGYIPMTDEEAPFCVAIYEASEDCE
jgi:hypothetical protein